MLQYYRTFNVKFDFKWEMNRGIVTLNDITNGLINVNIMEVQIVNSKKWPSTGAVRVLLH